MNVQTILKDIASTPRPAGTRYERAAAVKISRYFSRNNFRTAMTKFCFVAHKDLAKPVLSVAGKRIPCVTVTYSESCEIRGNLVFLERKDLGFGGFVWDVFGIRSDGKIKARIMGVVNGPAVYFTDGDHNARFPRVYVSKEHITHLKRCLGKDVKLTLKTGFYPDSVSQNVIACKKGRLNKEIIVSAHIDSVPGSPGVYDNASGVAVLILISDYFKDKNLKYPLKLIGFGAEEYDMLGSLHYTNSSLFCKERTLLTINLDGIASKTGTTCVDVNRYVSKNIKALFSVVKGFKIGNKVPEGTDGYEFSMKKVPTVSIIRWPNSNYHLPRDNLKNADTKQIGLVAKEVIKIIETINR